MRRKRRTPTPVAPGPEVPPLATPGPPVSVKTAKSREFENYLTEDNKYKYEQTAASLSPDSDTTKVWKRDKNVFNNVCMIPGTAGVTTGFTIKLYTRFAYDKDEDKFFGYYRLCRVSSTGRVCEIGVESREVLFETTLCQCSQQDSAAGSGG